MCDSRVVSTFSHRFSIFSQDVQHVSGTFHSLCVVHETYQLFSHRDSVIYHKGHEADSRAYPVVFGGLRVVSPFQSLKVFSITFYEQPILRTSQSFWVVGGSLQLLSHQYSIFCQLRRAARSEDLPVVLGASRVV